MNVNSPVFTDESRFSLISDSKRVYIRKETRTRNIPSNIIEIDYFGVIRRCYGMRKNNDRWIRYVLISGCGSVIGKSYRG